MKKLILAIVLVAMALFVWTTVHAAPTLIVGSLTTVSNTTATSSSVLAASYNPTLQQFSVTHSALTNLTSLRLDIYVHCDSATNGRVFIGSWTPTTTNAATETFAGSSYAITNWITVDVVTTNRVDVGGSYGN